MLVGFCQKPQRQSFPPPPTDSISSGFEAEPLFFPELPLRLGSNRFSVLLFFLYYSSQTTLITFFFFDSPCSQESESPMMLGDSRSDLEDVDP